MTGQNPEDVPFDPMAFVAETVAGAAGTLRLAALVDAAELILADAESRYQEVSQSFYAPDGYRYAFFPLEGYVIPGAVLEYNYKEYMELTGNKTVDGTVNTTGRFLANALGTSGGVLQGINQATGVYFTVREPYEDNLALVQYSIEAIGEIFDGPKATD